jgi:CubicO group peptidase (beta-lactamase class C family)
MSDLGLDVLGVLIARVAGQPLETFLNERIFGPLGMKDTGFSVPPEHIDRLATSYYVGGLGTSWYADPKEEMQGILMTQRAWASPNPPEVCRDFWTSAYQAIED